MQRCPNMRILIIEDEQKVAEFIRKGLQQEGYAVDVALRRPRGRLPGENFDYDAVILDLMLPQLPGLEVLREIRAHKQELAGVDLDGPRFGGG